MTRLLWLADVLRAADLRVVEVPGWKERGLPMGEIKGVIAHHTAGPKTGNFPSLTTVRDGRPGLHGPLSQLGLGRDGFFYVIAAGRANHAGRGSWHGIYNGNEHFIGIEAENTGYTKGPRAEEWSETQLDAYRRGIAAILLHLGLSADHVIGHKEWAPKRKVDPTFDMNDFRERVGAIMKMKKEKALKKEIVLPAPGDPTQSTIPASFEPWIMEGVDYEEWVKTHGDPTANVDPHLPKGVPLPPEIFIGKAAEEVRLDIDKLTGAERAIEAKKLLEELGWTEFQAAALIAQAMYESGIDLDTGPTSEYVLNKRIVPKTTPGAEPRAFGIMRWSGGRLSHLEKFIKYIGVEINLWKPMNDLELQVRFIDWELYNNEKAAGEQLKKSQTMMDALRAALAYVRPSNWTTENPENTVGWKDRVIYAYQLTKK